MKRQSRRTLCAAGLITAALASGAFAQQQEEKLGTLSFPTSCDPKVQAEFERGVAMIHSYWFTVARRTFEGVLQQDPSCAIAYWGIAMDLLGNSLVGPPSRENANAAWAALEKARAIGAKTERERGWIDAIRAYYRDHDKTDVETRLRTYNSAMEQMAQRYPDDYEVQVFYALTLQASASKTDMSYGNQLKSVGDPGKTVRAEPAASWRVALHHSRLRLSAAGRPRHRSGQALWRHRAGGAARASHAIAHLFDGGDVGGVDRLECIRAGNPARLLPCRRFHRVCTPAAGAGRQGEGADRQGDCNAAARRSSGRLRQLRGEGADGDALSARPRRLAGRCGDADESHAGTDRGFALSVHPGLGMARSGNLAGAKAEIEEMKALRTALQRADQSYWADRTEEQMLAISAWIAAKEGARDQALRFMRAAADGEDGSIKNVMMENRLYPLREMLAELLLEVGQPAAALKEYETALKHDTQPLPRVLGRRARRRRGGQPCAGVRVFRQAREPRQERRCRAAGSAGGQGVPGAAMIIDGWRSEIACESDSE